MIPQCDECGAPLNVPEGRSSATCGYCGLKNVISRPRGDTEARRTPRVRPPTKKPGWQPPPIREAPPTRPRQRSLRRRPLANPKVIAIVTTVLLVAGALPFVADAVGVRSLGEALGFELDLDGTPSIRTIDLDAEPSPPPLSGPTGQGVVLDAEDGAGCTGAVSSQPDVALVTTAPRSVDLQVDSNTDAVMVLYTSDGTLICEDDSDGNLDPRIRAVLPVGTHRVWVGQTRGTRGRFSLTVRSSPPPS